MIPTTDIAELVCCLKASGSISAELIEMIALAPTFMAVLGCETKPCIIEGRDLSPLLKLAS